MKVCFPVEKNEGVGSTVYNHFGSAPVFILVDTDAETAEPVVNADQQHSKGACSPIKALGSQHVDAVVVGGIGGGALGKLNQLGIKVYRAQSGTIGENLHLFEKGQLAEYSISLCCSGHDHGGSCSH